jgi:hypothetical protein
LVASNFASQNEQAGQDWFWSQARQRAVLGNDFMDGSFERREYYPSKRQHPMNSNTFVNVL